jgi:hypothetical protein
LVFYNVNITCDGKNNLQLYDYELQVFDYCNAKKKSSTKNFDSFNYFSAESSWVAIAKRGNVKFTFDLSFITPRTTTTTGKPIITTTISTQSTTKTTTKTGIITTSTPSTVVNTTKTGTTTTLSSTSTIAPLSSMF